MNEKNSNTTPSSILSENAVDIPKISVDIDYDNFNDDCDYMNMNENINQSYARSSVYDGRLSHNNRDLYDISDFNSTHIRSNLNAMGVKTVSETTKMP